MSQTVEKSAPSGKKRMVIGAVLAVAIAVIAAAAWYVMKPSGPGDGFVSGNGRIEATEIDISAKLGGRVNDIMANEGDFVKAGQLLAQMQVYVLDAQRDEARAHLQQAITAIASAEAQVAARKSDMAAAQAMVAQSKSELDAAQRRFTRIESLAAQDAVSIQELDDNRALLNGKTAAVVAAQAQVAAAQAAVTASEAQVSGARYGVTAAEATIARIEADIEDSQLKSPIDGRVQYRIAQPGEVLGSGGKVLSLVDLSDVYMTFFLPGTVVGRVALGSDARIILDSAPQLVIPAKVSFVASVAQFTPKTVETASEREKLMFRVRAQIDRELLLKHLRLVKTGLTGVAWLKLDPEAEWPANLAVNIPE